MKLGVNGKWPHDMMGPSTVILASLPGRSFFRRRVINGGELRVVDGGRNDFWHGGMDYRSAKRLF